MTRVELYEAFAARPGGGNPAGVVLGARELADSEMRRLARFVGASETAFVSETCKPRTYQIRYFSPETEVPFCGHATIASAIALAERHGEANMVMLTRAGRVPVWIRCHGDGMHASFTSVPVAVTALSWDIVTAALAALRWAPGDLDPRFPVMMADAGSRHLILAVPTRERLAQMSYDFGALRAVLTDLGAMTAQVFWYCSPREIHSRNPFPVGGVVEDPATGAAAAALGGYLRHVGVAEPGDRFLVYQGADMGRPSAIGVLVGPAGQGVTVSGRAVRVGDLRFPDP